jgi:Zn-dependent protease
MNCQICGQDTLMPFTCPYCGGQFCSQHRLPENHSCQRIGVAHTQRQEAVADSFKPTQQSYQYSISFGQQKRAGGHVYLGKVELKHLIVGALLVLAIGYSIALYAGYVNSSSAIWDWTITSVYALLLTVSFFIHEMAHKIVAQRGGLWSEFRITKWGAAITAISIILPFKLISPGAVMISGQADLNQIGKISIAGPITNMAFSGAFLGASAIALQFPSMSFGWWWLLASLATLNATIAIFNLIPFGILDGYKIFSWNKKIWAAAITSAILLAATSVLLTLPFYGY